MGISSCCVIVVFKLSDHTATTAIYSYQAWHTVCHWVVPYATLTGGVAGVG